MNNINELLKFNKMCIKQAKENNLNLNEVIIANITYEKYNNVVNTYGQILYKDKFTKLNINKEDIIYILKNTDWTKLLNDNGQIVITY